jgi:hypothetical protein
MRSHSAPSPARHRRLALGLAAAVTLIAACGGGGDGAADTTAAASTTTESVTTTVAPATTAAATTTSTSTSSTSTTTTEPPVPVYPLTGLPIENPLAGLLPTLVVKIDNAPGARPQTGFNAADIVFEEIVNDNLTRFAMVFHSRGSDPVGPIRSGRLQDIDLFGSFNAPLFAWSGGNGTVTAAIRSSDLVDIGPQRVPAYFRSNDRSVPHNLYANTTDLWSYAPPGAAPPRQQFLYRSEGEEPAGEPSAGVAVALDSIDVLWTWDPVEGVYRREMERQPHMDGAGGQVTTENVVVLVVEYTPGISGSPDAQTIGTGEAFIFTGGTMVHGTWTRNDRLEPFKLTDDLGFLVELTPGRTFIELPRPGFTLPLPAS